MIDQVNLFKQNPLKLDPDFNESCPCSQFEYKKYKFSVHCWRANKDCDCKFSGVHINPVTIEGIALAHDVAAYVGRVYHTEVNIYADDES